MLKTRVDEVCPDCGCNSVLMHKMIKKSGPFYSVYCSACGYRPARAFEGYYALPTAVRGIIAALNQIWVEGVLQERETALDAKTELHNALRSLALALEVWVLASYRSDKRLCRSDVFQVAWRLSKSVQQHLEGQISPESLMGLAKTIKESEGYRMYALMKQPPATANLPRQSVVESRLNRLDHLLYSLVPA